MAILQIQSEQQTPEWLFGGTTATLRIYASQTFYGTDGTQVTQGQVGSPNWYQEYTCTVSGGYVTIPQVDLQSTTDSTVPNATYTAVFFDSAGRQRNVKLGNFFVDPEYFQSSPFYAVEIADAGLAAINGTYTYRGQTGGYAYYNLLGEANSTTLMVVKSNGSQWIVTDSAGTTKYTSLTLTDNPYDGAWQNAGGGLPAPTVSQSSTYVSGTWEQVTLSNQGVSAIPPQWPGPFWNIPQIKEYVNSLVGDGTTPFASVTTAGKTALDTNPTLSTDPVAVAVNSNRIEKNLSSDYSNSLATAITDIGSDEVTLIIKNAVTVSADTTVPANITLDFKDEGVITVAATFTLTVGKMVDPGNRQVFVQAATSSNIRFSLGAVNAINIAWFVGDAGLCTNAINQAIASCQTNGGGEIFFPEGAWTTAGGHSVVANLIISGNGKSTTLTATGNISGIFSHEANIYNVVVKNIVIDGGGFTTACYYCHADNGEGSAGILRFENVTLQDATYGLRIHDTLSTEWQMAQISFDAQCRISNNTYGIWCNTSNNVGQCDAFIEVYAGQWGVYFTNRGQWVFTGEFAGDNNLTGTNQMETVTVLAPGPIVAGLVESVVTAPGMAGTPKTLTFAVDASMTTATLIATAFREALGNDPSVTTFFHIGGTGADVQLIPITQAANEPLMNFTLNTAIVGGATGITNVPSSTRTVDGVAPAASSSKGVYVGGAGGAINFIGIEEEGFTEFLVNDADDLNSNINFIGCTLQSAISLDASCTIGTTNCSIVDRTFRDSALSGSQYTSIGDMIPGMSYLAGAFRTLSARKTNNFSGANTSGSSSMAFEVNTASTRINAQYPATFYQNENFINVERGVVEAMSSNDPEPPMVRVGRCTSTGEPLYYYDIQRDYTTGYLNFTGNQSAFRSYVFDDVVYMPSLSINGGTALTTTNRSGTGNLVLTTNATLTNPTFTAPVLGTPASGTATNLTGTAAGLTAGNATLAATATTALAVTGLTATVSELNQLNDVSAYQESITAAGALSVTKVYSGLAIVAGGAVTLAAPNATMLGQQKTIERTIVAGTPITLALTNVVGGTAATTATFTNQGEALILIAAASKWIIVKEFGVVLT